MERFAQDIAADLARTLDARQRRQLALLIRAMAQDAEAEGAGVGIWYIAWHIIGLLERGATDTPPRESEDL